MGRFHQLVVFTRSNSVKMALSGVRGRLLHQKCGISNIKEGMSCSIPDKISWGLDNFITDMNFDADRTHRFMDVAYAMGIPVYELTYEDLQSDTHGTMAKLFEWLGKPHLAGERPADSGDGWVKRTSDSLNNVLLDYKEIEDYLLKGKTEAQLCYLPQLRTDSAQSFPPCYVVLEK